MRDVKELIEELSVYEKKEVCPECGKEPCECVCPKCGEKECKCESVNEEEKNKAYFEDKIIKLVNDKFSPLYKELFEVVKEMKEVYPDTNMYSFSTELDRKLDEIIESGATLKDIIEGKDLGKGLTKKIRKALGYNG